MKTKAVRSAITGRFVHKGKARANPKTTVTQTLRIKRRKRG